MTTREGEETFDVDTGNQEAPMSQAEEDEIDRLNKKSYWYVYAAVGLWYLTFSIWYGFAIANATDNGAITDAYPQKCTSE